MEDRFGHSLTLAIDAPFDSPAITVSGPRIGSAYPVGCVLAIKEPYVRIRPTTGIPEIRVSSPTDIVDLPISIPFEWRYESPGTPASQLSSVGPAS